MTEQIAAIGCKGERTVHQPVVKGSGRAGEICGILKSLGPVAAVRVVCDLLFSTNHYYVLGRSLSAPLDYPFARKPDLPLVPLEEPHITGLRQQLASLDPVDRREVVGRLHFHASGFTHCYVMTAGDEIAYLQWLILPAENEILRSRFSTKFYPLSERQVMVENVFTFPKFRGRGLLPYGTLHLLQLAKNKGFSSVICYIRKDNITSLNEFFRMGFKITKMVQEYKLLGRTWRTL